MNSEQQPWHTLSVEEVAAQLQSAPATGLDEAEAAHRLDDYGENKLDEQSPRPAWLKFLDQFKSLLIIILLGAAVLAWAVGDLKDAIVISIVVIFNGILGFYQEFRAERTLSALKGMLAVDSRVRRDGKTHNIEVAHLVPGDIVLLEAGDRVPADGRIVVAHGLEVDEAALTGESQAVGKALQPLEKSELPLGDRLNMLFMNTVVTRGRAEMVITATGMATEMGKLAGMIAQTQESKTPLQVQLDSLGKRLAAIAGVVIVVILGLDFMRGIPWAEAAMKAVALAVAAIPEGLPAVVTVTLAVGMWRMARNQAILKKLSAVETLGSTTVICSDKTGTLTLNQMTARAGWYAGQGFEVSGQGYDREGDIDWPGARSLSDLLLPMALCTETRVQEGKLIGDPTEGALYVLAQKGGLDPQAEQHAKPRVAEIPFDSSHKFMATFHSTDEWVEMVIKGAPDVLLERSSQWLGETSEQKLDETMRDQIETANEGFANQALRVLAVARRKIAKADFDTDADLWQWASDWTFLGLAGLMDPPRSEAAEAIAQCNHAGVQVKMITGDHKTTAAAIGRELGLTGQVITGAELDAIDADTLAQKADDVSVFARVAPEHKVKIVKALKASGHIAAMTGDGVNDAPALKAADIGVAMGITGTAVTKEAATLILTDDNFATIVRAVKEGRTIYDNIVKFVRFQLSTNIGAILTVLVATLMGLPSPFTAIQLLWINIIMDGPPAMTLGVEPARSGLMEEPPRARKAQILSVRRLARLLFFGIIMMIGTLYAFQHGLAYHSPAYALTMAFTVFVLFQFFNALNARAEHQTAFNENFFKNGKLWIALVCVIGLQVLVVHWPPAQTVFNTVPLTLYDWGRCVLVASSVLILEEFRKLAAGWSGNAPKSATA